MLTALRGEINALLASVSVIRKPALRRSDAPDALLATDLPFVASNEEAARFVFLAEDVGWRVWDAPNGWLLLDKPVPVPETFIPRAEGEFGCCLSLLARHQDQSEEAEEVIREIVRAAEAGPSALERLCGRLHARFAAMLRQGQALPGAALPYLAKACNQLEDRRNMRC